jgi:uncharacterized SAM-binding protein YcdF (DUF218 family)
MDAVWTKMVLKALILPPTGPLLVALVGLLLCARHPRAGRRIALAGTVFLLLISMPVVAGVMTRWLEGAPTLDAEAARTAQAMVILGGGVRRNAPEYGGDTLGRLTLERVRYGARVARLTGLPVLVSGGSVSGGQTEAKLMYDALEGEFGVPVRWMENRSRTTHENALLSAEILRAAGVTRIVLVAHAADMARARAEFTDAGLDVITAPTVMPSVHTIDLWDVLPSMSGLEASYHALYEIAALTVRAISPGARPQAAGGAGG